VIPGEQFEGIRKAVSESIDRCATGPIADRLKESIGFANGPTFHDRIERLLNRLPAALVEKLLGNPKEFEQALRQTRNFFTHQGGKQKSKVLTKPGELFLMNQKLHALLRWLLLTHFGFPAELVFEPVFQQANRLTIL
jgi:ApeA N-terminal domain 1